jgi:hypothetical protein
LFLTYSNKHTHTQGLSILLGGNTIATDIKFQYDRPIVYSVSPPELLAGTSSLLTVIGRNFGTYMAREYAGRVVFYFPNGDQLVGARVHTL